MTNKENNNSPSKGVCGGCKRTGLNLLVCDDDDDNEQQSGKDAVLSAIEKPRYCSPCMIGKKVKVFWPLDEQWYVGTVQQYDETTDEHLLQYPDGDTEWVKIGEIANNAGGADGSGGGNGGGGNTTIRGTGGSRNDTDRNASAQGTGETGTSAAAAAANSNNGAANEGAAPGASGTVSVASSDSRPPQSQQHPYTLGGPPELHRKNDLMGGGRGDPSSSGPTISPEKARRSLYDEPRGGGAGGLPSHYPGANLSAAHHYAAMGYPPGMHGGPAVTPHGPPYGSPFHTGGPGSAAGGYGPYGYGPPLHVLGGAGGAGGPTSPDQEKRLGKGSGHSDHGTSSGSGAGGGSTTPSGIKRKSGPKTWTKEEDSLLLNMVQSMRMPMKWSIVAQSMPDRTGKQCRERYVNHLNPRLKSTDWSPSEDAKIFHLYNTSGSQWAKMSKMIPGRTDNGIKNRFHNLRRQLEREDEHRVRLSKPEDFPDEIRLERLRAFPPSLHGKCDKLWDMSNGIGVLAAQSVLGGNFARNSGRFGPFKKADQSGEQCARCGLFAPSTQCGDEICTKSKWCQACTRIPPHMCNNLLRECLNLRRCQDMERGKIEERWDEEMKMV